MEDLPSSWSTERGSIRTHRAGRAYYTFVVDVPLVARAMVQTLLASEVHIFNVHIMTIVLFEIVRAARHLQCSQSTHSLTHVPKCCCYFLLNWG
eukprot:COSAG02_NODE_678_length_18586_cov_39.649375_9_plen_94_part_00